MDGTTAVSDGQRSCERRKDSKLAVVSGKGETIQRFEGITRPWLDNDWKYVCLELINTIIFYHGLDSTDWRLHRKLINPSFSSNVTNKFMPIFNKHMRIMSDCLEGRCGESNFDILFDMQKLAMDVICGL